MALVSAAGADETKITPETFYSGRRQQLAFHPFPLQVSLNGWNARKRFLLPLSVRCYQVTGFRGACKPESAVGEGWEKLQDRGPTCGRRDE
jgi:hypothetical protein